MIHKEYILVAIGGALGSVIRYGFSKAPWFSAGFLATFTVNTLGSLCIGFAWAYAVMHPENKWFSLLFITGFCGGFTTFSTFSLETMKFIQSHQFVEAVSYVLGSVITCLIAVYAGYIGGKNVW